MNDPYLAQFPVLHGKEFSATTHTANGEYAGVFMGSFWGLAYYATAFLAKEEILRKRSLWTAATNLLGYKPKIKVAQLNSASEAFYSEVISAKQSDVVAAVAAYEKHCPQALWLLLTLGLTTTREASDFTAFKLSDEILQKELQVGPRSTYRVIT